MAQSLRRRLIASVLALAGVAATTTGCGFHGLYSASLPGSVGGPFSSAKTYPVTVYFDDVLDLVPQSAVRVNDVVVGTVTAVNLVKDNGVYRAQVRCQVKTSVHLPTNTTAILEETSLLGEKYVELVNPATGGVGSLQAEGKNASIGPVPGQTPPAEQAVATAAYPGVEDVFGVLSMILNGGGLEKLDTINTELSAALAGREDEVHDVVGQLDTFVSGLNGVKTQINGAIDAVDTLSVSLNKQDATIATALDDLGPGLAVLANERQNLVTLLQGLSRLGVISNTVIGASLSATKADLALLEPILTQLDKAGPNLTGALEEAFDYPFPSTVNQAIKGDQTNLVINVNLSDVLGSECASANSSVVAACNTLEKVLPMLTGVLSGLGITSSKDLTPHGASLTELLAEGGTG
jgi:phospholipid/cholesterol/gamma-HCH transport system substrate-binding protein